MKIPDELEIKTESSFTFTGTADYVGFIALVAIGYAMTYYFGNIDLFAVLVIPLAVLMLVTRATIAVETTTTYND